MLNPNSKAFFIGVGGSGMSALAHILIDYGAEVWGQDKAESESLNLLVKRGLKLSRDIKELERYNFDFVVYSSAINKVSNEYYRYFSSLNTCLVHRSELMHKIFSLKKSISVAGSHGKTSTTAMIGNILWEAKLDPTIMVGGEVNFLGGKGGYFGKGEWGVYESDESDGTFLNYGAEIQVVTNIDNDHLDFYKTEENLIQSFQNFLELNPKSKKILCLEDENLIYIANRLQDKSLILGYSSRPLSNISNLALFSIQENQMNFTFEGKKYSFQSPFCGSHYLLNSLAAILAAYCVGIPVEKSIEVIHNYKGVKRRLELLGEKNGIKVYDDYGHHPREIQAVLESLTLLKKNGSRTIIIFQPHRYTRTRDHYKEFSQVLLDSNICYLLPIYSAGESPISGISSELIYENMKSHPRVSLLSGNLQKDVLTIAENLLENDLVITIGAGNVRRWGEELLKVISK